MRNRLTDETSPYLLQHKDNPVHWYAWTAEALAEAKRQDKPILLSIGYAACHWCHVMAHESFENDAIAGLMNDLFINIKVDREERPDIDAIYQSALAVTGQHGGWPLTMFLTPDGEPFWGGTYFPPAQRFGRPGFPDVLQQLAETYRTKKDAVDSNTSAIRSALTKLSTPKSGGVLTEEILDDLAGAGARMIDPIHGGTSGAPKFPQPLFFRSLWRAYKRTGGSIFRETVTLTLDGLCRGGIYDHLGGGFARYSTDVRWLVPHFEKMLYDNALLIDLLTEVWLDTKTPLYARRIEETVDWLMREMTVPGTTSNAVGFASALDADSEGVEGKYYVWSAEEVDAILGDAAPAFKVAYDVTPDGNWEGTTILHQRHPGFEAAGDDEAAMKPLRQKLLDARLPRIHPGRDDKVLADWNGLLITGLAHASMAFERPEWLEIAQSAYRFVTSEMADGDRLHHVHCQGQPSQPAVLDDYANMSRAALALFEITGDDAHLEAARAWVRIADEHYWDADGGGYFMAADDTTDIIQRPKTAFDNAVPSGNGVMLDVLIRLWLLTGEAAYDQRAQRLLSVFTPEELDHLINSPGLLIGFEFASRALQIVVIGESTDPAAQELLRAAFALAPANRVIRKLDPGASLPDTHPAFGKSLVDGKPAAYVCIGATCGLPARTAEDLRDRIDQR
jgi:uncharacterized protein YyaL (SSP411 family)